MTDSTLEAIEADLDRASDLGTDAAVELLRSARDELRACRDDRSIDQDRREALEHRLEQRIREIEERDSYSSGLGAAMNPDEEDAP